VDLLNDRASKYGSKPFVRFPQRTLSYDELAERSNRLAAGLETLDVSQGDRVGVLMANRPEFVEVFFASLRLGAILVPLNAELKTPELADTIGEADPSILVVESELLDQYQEVEAGVHESGLLVVGGEESRPGTDIERYFRPDDRIIPKTRLADPAVIQYTSGTTGMPKGAVLPQGQYLDSAIEIVDRLLELTEEDVLYMSQPLYHVFAQIVIMETLVAGGTMAMERSFSKSNFWDRVERYGATVIHFARAITEILYQHTDAVENPVRLGFGAIDDDLQKRFGEKFGLTVIPTYGLTECGPVVTVGTVADPCLGSMGRPSRLADVAVVDRDDNPVKPGEEGEVVVRPRRPNVMFKGYVDSADATLEASQNQWIHTGDVVRRDDSGRFHFVDRMGYFIRRKGENVSVQQVEDVLRTHPKVAGCAVVGVDAEVGSQEILTGVVPGEETVNPTGIIEYCEERLAPFKVPRFVLVLDSLPTTSTKHDVRRNELAERVDEAWDRER
jgi:crotonobetaine/carnitine-CoA ligase